MLSSDQKALCLFLSLSLLDGGSLCSSLLRGAKSGGRRTQRKACREGQGRSARARERERAESCVERGRKNSNAKSECSIFFSIPLKVFSLTLFGFALSFPSLLSFTRAVSFFSLSPAVVRLRSPTLILLSSRARPFKKQPCRPCSRRRSTSLSRSENNNREKKKLRQRLPTSMPPSRSSSEFVVVVVSHSLCAFQLSGRYQRTIGWRSADRNREKQTQKKEENRLKRRVHFNQQNAGRHCRSKKPQPRPPPSPLFST